jgi:hypothetical protein
MPIPDGSKSREFWTNTGLLETSEDKGANWFKYPKQKVQMGKQFTVSEGHRKDPKSGHYLGGGPFYTVLVKRRFPVHDVEIKGVAKPNRIIRAAVGTPIDLALPPGYDYSDPRKFRSEDTSDLDPKGATAVSQVAPTNPNGEAATALGEIVKDGLPSIPGIQTWKQRTDIARAAGSEYLNAVFGWMPLVKEVRNVSNNVAHSDTILQNYRANSGGTVRRSFSFPSEQSEKTEMLFGAPTVNPLGTTGWPFGGLGYFDNTEIVRTIKVSSKCWFSGAFTYVTPPSGDSDDRIRYATDQAHHLLGTDLTPNVLWELTPWSWAIDWFSNAGDVINNFTNLALQGLVMRYGYIMKEDSVVMTQSFAPQGAGNGSVPDPWRVHKACPPSTIEIVSKVRRPANPFGFGIGWEGLSPTKLAITAALGITRLR